MGRSDWCKFLKEQEEELFRELWNLISEVKEFAKRYPMLYRLYLLVATRERIERIKRQKNIQQFIAPDDIIAVMFSFFEKDKIPLDVEKIHSTICIIKKKYPRMLKEFLFSENDVYPFSRLLEKVLFRLQNSGLIRPIAPDFKTAILDETSKKYIRNNILPLFKREEQKELAEMGKLFEQLLRT
jgi:hypothetical protein